MIFSNIISHDSYMKILVVRYNVSRVVLGRFDFEEYSKGRPNHDDCLLVHDGLTICLCMNYRKALQSSCS